MSRRLSTAELELAEYHALGVKPDPADQTMARFERHERDRMVAEHAAEVADLKAHASELGDTIRSQQRTLVAERAVQRRTVSRLYLVLFGACCLVLYFYFDAVGCRA
jgi:hypothetical protein